MITENVQNGHGSIVERIAGALTDTGISRDALAALHEEVREALRLARTTVEAESESALDLNNINPDASDALVAKAKRSITRFEKALGAIRDKVEAIDEASYRAAWSEEYESLLAEEISLGADLAELYPRFTKKLILLFARIDYLLARGNALNNRAPAGETRRIGNPEVAARGIGNFNAEHPPIRDRLRLPGWIKSRDETYPEDISQVISRRVAENSMALAAAMERKHAGQFSPDWHEANKLRDKQERDAITAREEQEKTRQAESLAAFNRTLLADEARRRLGRQGD